MLSNSDVTDVTFPTSADADADVRLLTSADADADLHNPKQNACVTIEFSEIQFLIFMNYIQEGWKPEFFFQFISKYMYTMLVKLKFPFQISISKIFDRHPHPHFLKNEKRGCGCQFQCGCSADADVTHITIQLLTSSGTIY